METQRYQVIDVSDTCWLCVRKREDVKHVLMLALCFGLIEWELFLFLVDASEDYSVEVST